MKHIKTKALILSILVGIIIFSCLSYVNAETSIQSLGTFKQADSINLVQNCLTSSYSNISRIVYPNGTFALNVQTAMVKNGDDYSYTFSNTNTSGTYIVYGVCDESGTKTNWVYDFFITDSGSEANTQSAIIYIGLLFILVVFLILSIYSFVKFDNLLNHVGMLGLAYLLLIAITFVGWNTASEFLRNSPFIVEILRILFLVLMIGAFPLLIGAFAWYVLMVLRIKEIQSLIDKGLSMDEAKRRQGKKYK
jgi:hypothetical protein